MPDSLYSSSIRRGLSQGDVLEPVKIHEAHLGQKERTYSVMVLSHSCELDKPHSKTFLAAAVRPLKDFDPQLLDGIREGRLLALFYIPTNPPRILDERCVDFRQIFRVSFSEIGAVDFTAIADDLPPERIFRDDDIRIHSLSDFGVAALQGRIVAFFTRSRDME